MTSKYTKEILQDAVDSSYSIAEVLRFLGLKWAGGTHSYISNKIKAYEIDTSHFRSQAWNKGTVSSKRLAWQDVLVYNRHNGRKQHTYMLRRAMLDSGIIECCAVCSIENEWQGQPITLEIDHIDGNSLNDTRENLRFLCPNCHSQQTTTNKPHKYRSTL